jgi:hypothetical protein
MPGAFFSAIVTYFRAYFFGLKSSDAEFMQ